MEIQELMKKFPYNEYIGFQYYSTSPSGITSIVEVISRSSNIILGLLKWYGAWRQYIYLYLTHKQYLIQTV